MKNPRLIKIEDNKHVEVGDPYILRFNGKYYLYCSTCDSLEGIRCFISDDLVDFKYYGVVAKSPILKHAYAPEVIYYNGKFIMATSPGGNGHYFLESDSPLGPFRFISDNLFNMIDGSFVIDKYNKLHFIRADHNGIAYLDYSNDGLINRKDILPQIGNAWTEGPSITYYNGYYYATYCGNDVLSSSYRVFVASSKFIDKNYVVNDEPLLLSTKPGFSGLGHNSVVIGPSLDEYYVSYHKLDWVNEHSTTRYLCIDRLYFNKTDCSCNVSDFEICNPKMPDYACDFSLTKEEVIYDKLLCKGVCKEIFTAEFNFSGDTTVILGYVDDLNYYCFNFKDNNLNVYQFKDGKKIDILSRCIYFDFSYLHSVRFINDVKLEILVDNVPILKCMKVNKGRCGYVYKESGLYYTAYTNSCYCNSLRDVPFNIPGKIYSNYSKMGVIKNTADFYSLSLSKNKYVSYSVCCKEAKKYKIFARMKNNDVVIRLSSKTDNVICNIRKNECEYEYGYRYLGDIFLDTSDELKVEVIDGKFEYIYLSIIENNDLICFNKEQLNKNGYIFGDYHNLLELKFRVSKKNIENLFGLIINASCYSSWHSNKDLSYMGYFVGFDNNLLVVDYCRYNRTRIYDKPYKLLPSKIYKLKVLVIDNMIYVYINNRLEIKTCLKYDHGYGYCGVYKCKHSKVSLLDYKEGDQDEI